MNDKFKHFLAGAAASVVAAFIWLILAKWGLVHFHDCLFAVPIVAAAVGATKEAADWADNQLVPSMHGVEFLDFLATLAGSAPVVLLIAVVLNLTSYK